MSICPIDTYPPPPPPPVLPVDTRRRTTSYDVVLMLKRRRMTSYGVVSTLKRHRVSTGLFLPDLYPFVQLISDYLSPQIFTLWDLPLNLSFCEYSTECDHREIFLQKKIQQIQSFFGFVIFFTL